jgi:hypothetical protein
MDQVKKQQEELNYVKRLRNELQEKLADSDKLLENAKSKNVGMRLSKPA